MAEGVIIGGIVFMMGYVLGRLDNRVPKPDTVDWTLEPVEYTQGSTQPDFSEKATFITPNRVEEILSYKPDALIDDILA